MVGAVKRPNVVPADDQQPTVPPIFDRPEQILLRAESRQGAVPCGCAAHFTQRGAILAPDRESTAPKFRVWLHGWSGWAAARPSANTSTGGLLAPPESPLPTHPSGTQFGSARIGCSTFPAAETLSIDRKRIPDKSPTAGMQKSIRCLREPLATPVLKQGCGLRFGFKCGGHKDTFGFHGAARLIAEYSFSKV